MRPNQLKEKLRQDQPVYGVISPTTDAIVCEYLGRAGLDFYMIDGEHGAITASDITHLVRACEVTGCTPLARVRSADPKLILQYLDAGVVGIMLPGVRDARDVEALVAAVKYPPLGQRGLGPVRAAQYMMGEFSQAEYVEWANANTLVLPQIEDRHSLDHLTAILAVEGVDGVIVGPRDLAMSMGYYDGPGHPEVKAAIEHVFAAARAAGKLVGTVAGTAEQAQAIIDQGARLVLNSVQGLLVGATKAFLQRP